MQKKIYEDYEPISNIGVCSALLIVLGTAAYYGAFSQTREEVQKSVQPAVEVVKKTEKMPVLNNQKKIDQKERSN